MTDSEIMEQEKDMTVSEVPQTPPAPKPGARLAEFRVKAGMSVEQVASRLKMTTRQVHLIEADNYESMHSMAIARGFVRAYAKLLNVDPEPLVAMFPADRPEVSLPIVQTKRGPNEVFAGNRQPFKSRSIISGRLLGFLIVALIIIGGATAVWLSGWKPSLPSFSKSPGAKEAASRDASKKQAVPIETQQKQNQKAIASVSTELVAPKTVISEDAPKPVDAATQGAPASPSTPEAPVPSAPASTPEQAPAEKADTSSVSAAQKSKGALVLRSHKEAWVQVLRSDSTVLYERILSAGQTETIAIREPVTVIIGYAPGVEATFRGKRLELKTAENSAVARLNLNP